MNIVTTEEYMNMKNLFLQKHGDWQAHTSPMDSDGRYCKNYICDDGAIWTEVNRPVWKTLEADICKCHVSVDVKFFETEGFNTDDSSSIYCYEKY